MKRKHEQPCSVYHTAVSLDRGAYWSGRDDRVTVGLSNEISPTDFKGRQHQDLFGGKNPA